VRDALFRNIMEQELDYFDAMSTGVLISRLSEDVVYVLDTYVDKLNNCIQFAAQTIGGLAISFYLTWQVTLVGLAVLPVCAAVWALGEAKINKLWLEFRDTSTATAAQAEEVVTNFRTVKSFDNELYESANYAKGLGDVHNVVVKASHVHAIKNGLMQMFMQAILAPIIYYSCWLVIRKPEAAVEIGDMFTLCICLASLPQGMSQCITNYDDLKKAGVSAAKLLLVLDKEMQKDHKEGESLPEVRGKIEFRDVRFKYTTRDDYALDNLSFTIEAGETVAIVGESGCGMSTTLQLLQKFYEVTSGQILIDDVDISGLSGVFVRSQMAIVPQSPILFSMSVKDNIRFAKNEEDDEAVANAARLGNAHDFIMELPENYDTHIAQMSLSGGQKQRICISRAIMANCPILLLDEATAALDTESEQLVQQSLETFREGKTVIIVAHRLATVKHASRIMVMQNGRVAETGTHDELLARNGIYADLIKFQLQ
jgi:ABC-type multidrug transport system fused ATPase/permease subunit